MIIDRETNFPCFIVRALLDLHTTARAALENLQCTGCKNQIEYWTSSNLVMVIGSARLLMKKSNNRHDYKVVTKHPFTFEDAKNVGVGSNI
jgi:hypothetical protein